VRPRTEDSTVSEETARNRQQAICLIATWHFICIHIPQLVNKIGVAGWTITNGWMNTGR
jgi:hypothetical protein